MSYMIDSKSVRSVLERAREETKTVPKDTEFTVKDLFPGYVWGGIELNVRLKVGSLFLDESRHDETIEVREKNSANQQLYKKR